MGLKPRKDNTIMQEIMEAMRALTITRNLNHSLTLDTIYKSRLVSRTFYFYTVREAKRIFKAMLKELKD